MEGNSADMEKEGWMRSVSQTRSHRLGRTKDPQNSTLAIGGCSTYLE